MKVPPTMRVAIVHYHLDPGGVTRVIESASHALTAAGIQHVILAGGCGVTPQAVLGASRPESLPIHIIPALGYLTTPGTLTAAQLTASLLTTATAALGAPPDLWHFHNHSLGKNCLIPEVIAHLAAAGEHLVLQIHDLAEQGRPANYPLIADCEKLYPVSPRIHYAFLNARDLAVFTAAGLPAENSSILINPVVISSLIPPLAAGPPILFAPIRGIRRKNLGELVFLAALAPAGTRIAISRAPRNPAALPVHDTWQKFANSQRLPIAFDVVDRFAPAVSAASSFESWLAHATHFITTSVSEGFGLPFLEAAALGKPLVGRNLPHLTAEHARQGIRTGHLYDRLLVPTDWIDLPILEDYLTADLERTYRAYRRPLSNQMIAATLATIIGGDYFDFGNLPEPLQQAAIERLADFPNRKLVLVQHHDLTEPAENWLAAVIADRKPTATPAQLAPYSISEYQKTITVLYADLLARPSGGCLEIQDRAAALPEAPGRMPAPQWPGPPARSPSKRVEAMIKQPLSYLPAEKILTSQLAPGSFHFLLAALKPDRVPATAYRAVVFDIYGTLLIAAGGGVRPDPAADPALRRVLESFGHQPPDSPSTELHAAILRHHAAAGIPFPEIDLRVLWREVLALEPGTDTTELVTAIEAAWHPVRPMPGASQAVQRLARAGISLGLLSNAQCNTLPSLGAVADLFAPELTLLSYQHGIAKPAPELFQILTDRLAGRGITPAETLFIGNDPSQDILPAAAAGFLTALFTGHPDSLRPGGSAPDFTIEKWAEFRC